MASTYVEITREDFEDWLDSLRLGVWKVHPQYKSVYTIALSPSVGVSISSTVGSRDKAMGTGRASGSMKMVSLVTGQVLNKKAMGQSHFARTTNWRINWKKGLDRIIDAYKKSKDFYEAIAKIDDRQAYRAEIMTAIEAVPNWEDNNLLSDFHGRVRNNGILTDSQRTDLDKEIRKALTAPAPSKGSGLSKEDRLQLLRDLWVAANRKGDNWVMDFSKSLADRLNSGRDLTERQKEVLFDNLAKYGL